MYPPKEQRPVFILNNSSEKKVVDISNLASDVTGRLFLDQYGTLRMV